MTERFDLEKTVKIVGLNIHAENADEGKDFDVACRMIVNAIEENQAYQSIGTIEEFKALKEKSEGIPIIHGKAELELHDEEIRAKAIDEFAERLKSSVNENYFFAGEFKNWTLNVIDEIAEEMRGAE